MLKTLARKRKKQRVKKPAHKALPHLPPALHPALKVQVLSGHLSNHFHLVAAQAEVNHSKAVIKIKHLCYSVRLA